MSALPLILVVDDDVTTRVELADELQRRYSADYAVEAVPSAEAGDRRLRAAAESGQDVALVLADQWMPDRSGFHFLADVDDLHPHAKRALIIDQGDRKATGAILQGMTLGEIDHYLTRPWRPREVRLYRPVGSFLAEWVRARREAPPYLVIVGDQWTARCHELKDILDRNGIAFEFRDADSDAGLLALNEAGVEASVSPVVIPRNRPALLDPSNIELAEVLGVHTEPQRRRYDLAIIGAGPSGLGAAVYAASEGLRTLVVEREAVGGQAASSSRIRNYLGFPRGVSGGELAWRAYEQAWLFGTEFIFAREAVELAMTDGTGPDERASGADRSVPGAYKRLTLSAGADILARAVIIASGITYRHLGIENIDRLLGAGVYYGGAVAEARAMAGEAVAVIGGGNAAGQAAVHLSRYATCVHMLVRGPNLSASMSEYLIRELEARKNIYVRFNTTVEDASGQRRLEGIRIREADASELTDIETRALFVMIGAEPRTDYLAGRIARDRDGYLLTGEAMLALACDDPQSPAAWSVPRPPLHLETNLPGVFAAGDVRHGSFKRVASAVGDGAAAVAMVHEYLALER